MLKLSTSYLLTYLITLVVISSCGARKERSLFNAPSDIITDTITQVYVVNEQGAGEIYYRIKINDLLAIRNLQDREFGVKSAIIAPIGSIPTSYQVEGDGNVNFPAIGKVTVVGLTRKEIAAKLQTLYEAKLLVDPIIEVTVVNVKVTLLGEFNKQGNFLLERDNTTLIDILGEAGGINTKTADPKTLKIIRGDRSNPEIIYVNLNDINSLASKKLILQNNDLILLQPTKSIAISDKMQGINNLIQPVLVLLNVALLIFSLTK